MLDLREKYSKNFKTREFQLWTIYFWKRQKWIFESKFDFRKLRVIKQAEIFFKDQPLCTLDTRPEVFH